MITWFFIIRARATFLPLPAVMSFGIEPFAVTVVGFVAVTWCPLTTVLALSFPLAFPLASVVVVLEFLVIIIAFKLSPPVVGSPGASLFVVIPTPFGIVIVIVVIALVP